MGRFTGKSLNVKAPWGKALPKTSVDESPLVFSFRYFRQTDFFGLKMCDNGWLVALLERLGDLGKYKAYDLITDTCLADTMHFHPVDWEAKNIPITKDKVCEFLVGYGNTEEILFYQCAISRAMGRFVGFISEGNVFEIVLLDPNHNICPSKMRDNNARPTKIGVSSFDDLFSKFQQIPETAKKNVMPKNMVYFNLDGDDYEILEDLLQKGYTREQILQDGLHPLFLK